MIFLALIYLAFISLGIPDAVLGSAWPMMHLEIGAPVGNAGFISMVISTGTIISSLLSHRVIQRYGTGRVTVASVAMTAIALLGFSVSPSMIGLMVSAIPLGLGAGAVDAGLNEFVAEHYEARHMNWLHCFWGVGAMLGPILISALMQGGHSWRSGYFGISMLQFALVALLALSLPMWKKREGPSLGHTDASHKGKARKGLLAPLRVDGALYAMLTFFLYAAIEASVGLWGASYLVDMKGILPKSAAGWVSLFFLGITAGRMLSGFVSMKFSNEEMIRIGTMLVIAGTLLLLLPLPAPVTIGGLVVVGLGLAPIFPSMLHQTPVYFGQENAQATMGFQMAFAYTGTTLMPPLFGQIFAHVSFSLMPWMMLVCGVGVFLFTSRLAALAKKRHTAA